MLAVWLMLLSAALHAGWNFALRRHGDAQAATLLVVMGSLACALCAWPLLPSPAGTLARSLPWGLCAGLAEALYFATLGRALQIGPLGAVYAISRGVSLLLLWPASHWLLGEPIGPRSLLAVALLLFGLWLLAPSGRGRATSRAGYGWATLCALFVVANHLLYKTALARGGAPEPLYVIALATALPMLALTLGRGRFTRLGRALRHSPPLIGFGSVAVAASFLIALHVLLGHGAAWMMTLRNSSIGFAQLLGWTLLGERPRPLAVGGVGLVFAGALLLGP
ncbi:MAG: EamA family transporter [Deltaproteobacteria bacterium]